MSSKAYFNPTVEWAPIKQEELTALAKKYRAMNMTGEQIGELFRAANYEPKKITTALFDSFEMKIQPRAIPREDVIRLFGAAVQEQYTKPLALYLERLLCDGFKLNPKFGRIKYEEPVSTLHGLSGDNFEYFAMGIAPDYIVHMVEHSLMVDYRTKTEEAQKELKRLERKRFSKKLEKARAEVERMESYKKRVPLVAATVRRWIDDYC